MRSWALAALLALSVTAWAGEVQLSCQLPTERTDGTPLTVEELADITVYWGPAPGGPYDQSASMGLDCAHTVTGLEPGNYYFVATATDTDGLESDYSNEAAKVVQGAPPAPPMELVTLTPDTVAYAISMSADELTLYPVGTVPAGLACDGSAEVNGLYMVPRDAVDYQTTQRPAVVFAECG